jgi:hypothetical protein
MLKFLIVFLLLSCVLSMCRRKVKTTIVDSDKFFHLLSESPVSEQPPEQLQESEYNDCEIIGKLSANVVDGKCYPAESYSDIQYDKWLCSPPIYNNQTTFAKMTVNGFDQGEEGGWPSYCDGKYHRNTEKVVALSTGWFNDLQNCGKIVRIYANGRVSEAKVVDECDSRAGCDEEHAFLPPCKNNIIDTSSAVWDELGLNQIDGIVDVVWEFK